MTALSGVGSKPRSADPTDASAPEEPMTDAARVGWVRYFFEEDRWEWSPEVAQIHGYEPGSVTPTTELVLSHKHPKDRQRLVESLERIRSERRPFSSRHRICDTKGDVHHVLVAGHELRDDTGRVIGTDAFYLDLTADENAHQQWVGEEIEKIAENRAVIEQAKGMLMVVYEFTADDAFGLLRWRSQLTNVKLRQLAEQIVKEFSALNGSPQSRAVYDNLLMTAHDRVEM